MQLSEYLDKDLIVAELNSSSKPEVLAELLAPLGGKYPHLDLKSVLAILMDRESLGSTGIGDGVAIPHGKLDNLERVIVAVGRSQEGVDFQSLDHKPARIFFLVLAPEQVAGMHLRILATVSRLLQDTVFRQEFLDAPGCDALWDMLRKV
ncbi:MAG: PTS sugar transporter subunit IIA [Deltaproteobacteria bacterium]|nr:PTS sugar transporter subunit IIA [Deltaproteobacteria bacterium]